jgi:hypothetical protein
MLTNIVSQPPSKCQALLDARLPDGIHYDTETNEYVVIFNGEIINFATHLYTAQFQYLEALRVNGDHYRRCPEDIPFLGEPCYPEPLTVSDEYGLEARGR